MTCLESVADESVAAGAVFRRDGALYACARLTGLDTVARVRVAAGCAIGQRGAGRAHALLAGLEPVAGDAVGAGGPIQEGSMQAAERRVAEVHGAGVRVDALERRS